MLLYLCNFVNTFLTKNIQKTAVDDGGLGVCSAIVYVKHHNGAFHAAVLEVGGGDDNAVLGQ